MNDNNVIILGAGFSFDAGIPMLSNFIDRMLEYHLRGKTGGTSLHSEQLSIVDKKTLEIALKIRSDLDGYHGRVNFDDRNIEDLLSMLAFNVLGGSQKDKNQLNAFTAAISTTIELACNVKHPGYLGDGDAITRDFESDLYQKFWLNLFKWFGSGNGLPTIISFNYDLVLERSFYQTMYNTHYDSHKNQCPFTEISINYHYPHLAEECYKVMYIKPFISGGSKERSMLRKIANTYNGAPSIDFLKLHGSLNFPRSKVKEESPHYTLTIPLHDPFIIPPVSNKQTNGGSSGLWKVALNKLRTAKNIVFVGYSLPKTDMYMQFFLKAALGPNKDLNKIFVFDPVLYQDNEESKAMRARYENCFSEQIRPRINFKPFYNEHPFTAAEFRSKKGTTDHFIEILENRPEEILF